MTAPKKKTLLNEKEIENAITLMGEALLKSHENLDTLALIGIVSSGYPIAQRLQKLIQRKKNVSVPVGKLDVSLYRDDLLKRGDYITIRESNIPFDIKGKTIVIVDDVLFHGRTIRAALNAIMDFGRPDRVELAVLIDRGFLEFPIKADYVGKVIKTNKTDYVEVSLLEITGEDCVKLVQD